MDRNKIVTTNGSPVFFGSREAGITTRLRWNPIYQGKISDAFNRAQSFADSEVLRLSAPYIPFRSGTLQKSGPLNTVIGSGKVEQKTPYARKMWVGSYNFHGAPKRGSYWAVRMLNEGGREKIVRGVKRMVKEIEQ